MIQRLPEMDRSLGSVSSASEECMIAGDRMYFNIRVTHRAILESNHSAGS